MEREKIVLVALFVVLAGVSASLYRTVSDDLLIYLAGAILGAAASGIAVQIDDWLDR